MRMAKKREGRSMAKPASPTVGSAVVTAPLKREDTVSPNFFSVYANDVSVQTTPWDIRLLLGELSLPTDQDRVVRVKQIGELRLSPQLAKRVIMIIAEQLKG